MNNFPAAVAVADNIGETPIVPLMVQVPYTCKQALVVHVAEGVVDTIGLQTVAVQVAMAAAG